MRIRKATIRDVNDLSRLSRVVQQMHVEAYPEIFKSPEGDDYAVSFFTSMLNDPTITIYFAEENEPIGYIFLRVVNREENPFMHSWRMLYVEHISVQPDYQGKGVGKALMVQAEKLAEQEGLDQIWLDSWGFNTKAHEFFHAQGYEKFNLRMWKKIG